ncbi:glucosyltransferase domain-containing protein [Paenibacillus sp. FSL M7-0420]|uniref:glucosyltransferase domain-containing protein n=1 Tax=Paenibacillus sp. FSL M7-0420 TaxID=2921609 RepID=UPI0030F8479B
MLRNAIIRDKYYWVTVSLTIALAYGFTLTNFSMGVDDESFELYISDGGLLAQGRWGGYIARFVINTYDFLPFWRDLLGVLLIAIGITFWGYIIQKFSDNYFNNVAITVFACVAISCPLIADNFIFMLTTIEMGTVFCLIPLALNGFFEYTMQKRNFLKMLPSVFLCNCALAFSELAIVYFLFGVFMLCFISVNFSKSKTELLTLLKGLFFIAVVIFVNSIITSILQKIFSVAPSGYTSNYIKYDLSNVGTFMDSLSGFIKEFVGFKYIWHSMGIYMAFISALVLLIYSAMCFIKNKKISIFLSGLGCVFSAFSMYFITGNLHLVNRIFITNSVFTGFVAALIYMCFSNKEYFRIKFRIITTTLIVLIVLYQTKYMNQVFYVDYQRYQLDLAKMNSIAMELERYNAGNNRKEVVFIGLPENYNLKLGDTEGYSIFQWDRFSGIESELKKSGRIFRFMNLHGHNIKPLTEINEQEILNNAEGMECFPHEGYVKDVGKYLIVKLGPTAYEVSNLALSEFYKSYILDSTEVKYTKDWFSYEGNLLSMGGWAGINGDESPLIKIQVTLISKQRQYFLKTNTVSREDSSSEGLNTGYHIYSFDTSNFEDGEYEVALIISDNLSEYVVKIGENIQIP